MHVNIQICGMYAFSVIPEVKLGAITAPYLFFLPDLWDWRWIREQLGCLYSWVTLRPLVIEF
jgi:hypothetical protein